MNCIQEEQQNTMMKKPGLTGGLLSSWQLLPRFNRAWLVWFVSAIFVLFQFLLQLTSGEIVTGVMKSFSLTAVGGSVVVSSYYYIYVLLQSPAGMLVDRYGPRCLLSVGALIVMLGCTLFGIAPDIFMAIAGRLLMGCGAAFAFVGSLNLISRWFPSNRFGMMTAIVEVMGMVGSVAGGLTLANSIQHVGWRVSMLFLAGISALIAVLIWTVVRDKPNNVTVITARPLNCWWSDARSLFTSRLVWLNALYSGVMFLMVTTFVAFWAVPFVENVYHQQLNQATFSCDLVFIGIACSSPVIGWLDSRFDCRRWLMVGCPLVAIVCLFVVVYCSQWVSHVALDGWMFVLGVSLSSYLLTFVIGNELATPSTRSTSVGFVNMISVGTAPIVGPLVGWVLDKHQSMATVWNSHQMLVGYEKAFSIFLLGLVAAVVLGCYLPKRPTSTLEDEAPSPMNDDMFQAIEA